MEDMEEIIATNIMDYHNTDIYPEFSIEKFCYYLLSPWFLREYTETVRFNRNKNEMIFPIQYNISANKFWEAIYEYQSGDEQHLIELLSKIK